MRDDNDNKWKIDPRAPYLIFHEAGRDPQVEALEQRIGDYLTDTWDTLSRVVDADPPMRLALPPGKPFHYILDGDTPVPTDLMTWARFFEDYHNRMTARTYLSQTGEALPTSDDPLVTPDDTVVMVSTVFLGIDHGFAWQADDLPPILFETMIHVHGEPGDDGAGFLAPQWRYTTAAQARATHARIVGQCQQWLRDGRSLAEIGDDEWVNEDGELMS